MRVPRPSRCGPGPELEHGGAEDVAVGGLRNTAGEYSLSMITKVSTRAPAKAGVTRTRRTRKNVISQSAPDTRAALWSSAPICMMAGATEPNALGSARIPKAMISAPRVPCSRVPMPKGAKAKAQKKPMPMMMPGMDCGIRARYSTARPNLKVERRETITAMTARLLTKTEPTPATMMLFQIDWT